MFPWIQIHGRLNKGTSFPGPPQAQSTFRVYTCTLGTCTTKAIHTWTPAGVSKSASGSIFWYWCILSGATMAFSRLCQYMIHDAQHSSIVRPYEMARPTSPGEMLPRRMHRRDVIMKIITAPMRRTRRPNHCCAAVHAYTHSCIQSTHVWILCIHVCVCLYIYIYTFLSLILFCCHTALRVMKCMYMYVHKHTWLVSMVLWYLLTNAAIHCGPNARIVADPWADVLKKFKTWTMCMRVCWYA